MGQTVKVVEQPTSTPGIVRFELNRSLTGMAHERYRKEDEIIGDRPPDVLARRLFERGDICAVHLYSNQVTVELEPFASTEGIRDTIEGLYTHYTDGVEPKQFPTAS